MSLSRLVTTLALVAAGTLAARAPDLLTSRPRPAAPPDPVLAAGQRLVTAAGEQRRVRLADGSLVFVRQRTTLTATDAGFDLRAGEVFVESAAGKLAPAVTVQTPKRTVEGRDSRFAVRAGDAGTAVVVASGGVTVSGVKGVVAAGQQLAEAADAPARAPRVSQAIEWTRGLRSAALVPASGHAGGSLVAKDADGGEGKLELRRYHLDVHVEDGFARTTIDQTYFNHHLDRLEGTFRFPLPPDASLSRLAMYVDGNLMEGGMAEREHARDVYERIRYQNRDPALLEWVDGSTFKMRVFPLEPRQEKRIVLSYTQRLPALAGQQTYRFPAGHSLGKVARWSAEVRVKGGAGLGWRSESHALTGRADGGDLVLRAEEKDAALDRDVVLTVTEKEPGEARFSTVRQDGANYLLVRYRPDLAAPREPQRRDWVVVVETSGDRDPLLARTQIEFVRAFLSNAGRDDTFAVITAATRATPLMKEAVPNDPAAVEAAMAALENAHLIGAFDFGAALAAARPLLDAAKSPHVVHVGSGIPAMGERAPADLLRRLPPGARYVGVGVGRRWDRALMQTLAEKTGGYFTQVNPDEPVAWRGLELAATLDTPRLLDAAVTDPSGKATFLAFHRLVCQGEELAAVCRVEGELPAEVRVTGTLDGKPFARDLEVKDAAGKAEYLPRSWAKLEIDRMLAEDAAKHKAAVTELSKKMYVLTPFTSLLVLENDDMYTQFKVDRGRKDHWAMYPAPAKIEVVVEPLGGDAGDPRKGIKPSRKAVAGSVVWRRPAAPATPAAGRVLALGDEGREED
ncbi:MAG: VIT domain-containing protein, partial [Gemmataceae bacterium]